MMCLVEEDLTSPNRKFSCFSPSKTNRPLSSSGAGHLSRMEDTWSFLVVLFPGGKTLTCPDKTDKKGEPEEPADLPPVVHAD